MFKQNNQPALLTFEADLSENQRKKLDKSKEELLYGLIMRDINGGNFKPIDSGKACRPNIEVNILVSAIILKEHGA